MPPPASDEAAPSAGTTGTSGATPAVEDPYGTEGDAPADAPLDDDPWTKSSSGVPDETSDPQIVEPPPAAVSTETTPPVDYASWHRRASLREQNTLGGSTGLHRVRVAGSGAPGTFRFGLTGGFFVQTGFLCTVDAPCTDPVTGATLGQDNAQKIDAIASLSVTPFSFLEAYLTFRNSATSNSNGAPRLLQVVGDTALGVKAFFPSDPDRIFYFGGEAELGLLTGTGGVGLDGGATSFGLRALGTLDLFNRTKEEDRFPLRAHLNLGYYFDNSASVVSSLERTPFPIGRGSPIERTERYGLGISRVDSFEIGLGVEYINDYVRPFVEWTADIPVNRQGYVCNVQSAATRGDYCLGVAAGLNTSPNRFTLGARGFPWQESGLALTAALDLGTGATGFFLEEVTPEATYTLWFGASYAVDVVPPEPKIVRVEQPVESAVGTRRFIVGRVANATGDSAIPDAIVRYKNAPYTGMVADAEGRFTTTDLPPGKYEFQIYAEQFKEGTCTVVVPEDVLPEATTAPTVDEPFDPFGDGYGQSATGPALAPTQPKSEAIVNADGDIEVSVTCQMKELPRVANVVGLLVDAVNGGAIADANVTITDKLNRSLTLAADAQGSLVFQNVPFGRSHLTVSAPGYLSSVMVIDVDSRKEVEVHIVMNKRPQKLDVEIDKRELKLLRPLAFVGETAEISSDTMIVVEELAQLLKENPKLAEIEVQVHSDDSGAASYSRRLTQERADAIRDTLVRLGVAENRVVAKGYGPDQPLVPNVSDTNRETNKRVQILITKR